MDLNLYNKACVSQYHGTGYLILQGGHHVNCAFYACQFFNGNIHILCKFITVDAGFMAFSRDAVRFEGKTSEGFLIFSSGKMHRIKGEIGSDIFAKYSIEMGIYITINNNIKADKLIFGLTNLDLDGEKHKLKFELQNDIRECIEIELVPTNDYTLIVSQLEALNGVNVTYQAIIEIGSKEDPIISERLVEDLWFFAVLSGYGVRFNNLIS